MTPKVKHRTIGVCVDCGKPTKRDHSAFYCWDCVRNHVEINRVAAAKRRAKARKATTALAR